MKRLYKCAAVVGLFFSTFTCFAQQDETMPFDAFFQTMLVPQPSLRETMQAKADAEFIDRKMAGVYKTINANLSALYGPVYERYQKAAAGNTAMLTKAEQTILTSMKQGARGLSASVQFDFFKSLMEKRPLVLNGKPMWSNETVAGSADVQAVYQQLKTLEASFDWKSFQQAAEGYLPKFGDMDPAIGALNKKLTADLETLPKKKVTMKGGFTQEMEDPEEVVKLWKQHGAEKEKTFAQQYNKIYAWWKPQYTRLKAISEKLDELKTRVEGDYPKLKTAQSFLADLQIRTWEALYRLSAVSQRLYNDTLIALASEQQIDQMTKIYTGLKDGAK